MGSFCRKQKIYELQNYRDVISDDTNEKSEEELTCRFKTDIMNSTNFDSRSRMSQKFIL